MGQRDVRLSGDLKNRFEANPLLPDIPGSELCGEPNSADTLNIVDSPPPLVVAHDHIVRSYFENDLGHNPGRIEIILGVLDYLQ